jgi:glycosylphosphatidylinositol transamidase (GPIT) subunit GPI8
LAKRIPKVTMEHKLKLSQILADYVSPELLSAEYIVPTVFDRNVAEVIARGM